MYLTIQAIVLRVTDYNDRDALLTVLSKNHGKLTIKARGLRRKNSPLVAPCQLLAFGEFTLFEYKGQYTINEAQSLELFSPLRRDLTKLSLGTYFAQAAEVISQEDLPNPELQSLLLNCLFALSKLDISEAKVKAVFELAQRLQEETQNTFKQAANDGSAHNGTVSDHAAAHGGSNGVENAQKAGGSTHNDGNIAANGADGEQLNQSNDTGYQHCVLQ